MQERIARAYTICMRLIVIDVVVIICYAIGHA